MDTGTDRFGSLNLGVGEFGGDVSGDAPMLHPTIAMATPGQIAALATPAQTPPAPPPQPPPAPAMPHRWLDRLKLWWSGFKSKHHHHAPAAPLPPAPPPIIGVEFGADSENPALIVGCDAGCPVDSSLRG